MIDWCVVRFEIVGGMQFSYGMIFNEKFIHEYHFKQFIQFLFLLFFILVAKTLEYDTQ